MGNYVLKKFPIKTCGVSDDLSGDMLAPSWPNLVISLILHFVLSDKFILGHTSKATCVLM